MKKLLSDLGLIVAKIRTEEKYKPFLISMRMGIIGGIISSLLFIFGFFSGGLTILLTAILPSALVLHLSSTLSKKLPDSWQNIKTRLYCLTSLLLLYVYVFFFTFTVVAIWQYTSDYISRIFGALIFPYYPLRFFYNIFYKFVMYYGGENALLTHIAFPYLLTICVALVATRGMKNKFNRIIATSLLAILILVVSLYPMTVLWTT